MCSSPGNVVENISVTIGVHHYNAHSQSLEQALVDQPIARVEQIKAFWKAWCIKLNTLLSCLNSLTPL